jgi:hypothetical protein
VIQREIATSAMIFPVHALRGLSMQKNHCKTEAEIQQLPGNFTDLLKKP